MKSSHEKIITRFAPSPTGYMHMGSVRTALYGYFFTRQNNGKFILRIEDTDKTRSKKEFDDGILDAMKWLGLEYDELYRQSERGSIYRKYIEKLIKEGKAFISKEEVIEGAPEMRSEVIRFRNPNKIIKFTDLVRGEIEFDTKELGDFVIAKSLDEPVFHLAVVVDDYEMGITHVIRGEDHISNTPRHILLFEAIGATCPTFAHLPLVLAPDRTKLSKRKHGEMVALEYYKKLGYLSDAIINFMSLLGWNPGTDREVFGLKDLINEFDISKVQKGGAIFNVEKLKWFNKHYIQQLKTDVKLLELKKYLSNKEIEVISANPKLVEVMMERVATFAELRDLIATHEYNYFFGKPILEKKALLWKGAGDFAKTKERLVTARKLIESVSDNNFNRVAIKEILWPYAEKEGRGEVLWPIRVSLSGKEKSPDPFVLAEMLGKSETLERLDNAINLIS